MYDFTPLIGTDLRSGKRDVDLWKMVAKNQIPDFASKYGYTAAPSTAYEPSELPTTNAIPELDPEMEQYRRYFSAVTPFKIAEMEAAADIASRQSQRQLSQLYPYLSRAGAEATARSLYASEQFLRAKQQAPSTVQDIMASKQGQMLSAASAEAERQRATAAQQEAASRFPGRFAGQYIQVG